MYQRLRQMLKRVSGTKSLAQGEVPQVSSEQSPIELPLPPGQMPPSFGKFWREKGPDLAWYTWMYNTRLDQHLHFQHWFRFINALRPVESVADFGCGLAVGYADFLESIRYVGVDIAEDSIAWCLTNRQNPKHDYIACNFISEPLEERFDIVFSQGTIDNVYDIDAFLRAAVAASRGWVYITAYRGFFADLEAHRYTWNAEHGCYYNDISPTQALQTLRDCNCSNVVVVPSCTGRENIPFETLIIAQVGDNS